MKTLAAILALAGFLALAAPPAFAQWTGSRVGSFTYWTSPSGQTVTCSQVGTFTYCN